MLRNFLLFTLLGALSLFYYHSSSITTFQLRIPLMAHARPEWSSPFAGWHARALETPLADPHAFTPTTAALVLAVLRNAPAEHEGMTLALFTQPNGGGLVAVDTLGRVLRVPAGDAVGLLRLAEKALELPGTGRFRNTWVVKHDRTSQPIERIFVPATATAANPGTLEHFKQVSVQGFDKTKRELKEPVGGITELPDELWEFAGLVLEAREGGWEPERRDQVVLGKVREVVGSLF